MNEKHDAGITDEPAGESSRIRFSRWRDVATPVAAMAIGWTLFQTIAAFAPFMDTLVKRSAHVSFAVGLALLITSRGGGWWWKRGNEFFALLALTVPVLVWTDLDRINDRFLALDPLAPRDYFCVFLLLALLIEAARRLLGWGMIVFSLAFIVYYFGGEYWPGLLEHSRTSLYGFVEKQILAVDGMLGVPVGVSVDIVFYFILFAAFFEIFGGGQMIIDFALAVTGRTTGGPAKAAVLASGMMGSVSGSAISNVMSTGIFTIPLMMRVKYGPKFAGAVEAVASTGGQIMPPVMGAAAFIMADFLQMPYSQIVLAALLPAILYFLSVLASVDLEARRKKLPLIRDVPSIGHTLRRRGLMILPLAWLMYRIVDGHNVTYASVEAIGITIVLGLLNPATRRGPLAMLEAFARASERAIAVALPCALAGIIISVIAFTGLGTKFTTLMVDLSGGLLPLILLFAMIATIVLGAGMPTSSAYIMGAVLIAPALIRLGLDPLVAHFFVLYFAILSMLTPPVALSAYAAATISGASASATGWTAARLAIPGFVIPYGMVLHPGLLLAGTWWDTVFGVVSVLFGFLAFAPAIVGWLFRDLKGWERVVAFAFGVLSIAPDPTLSLLALGAIALGAAWLWREDRRGRTLAKARSVIASGEHRG